MNNIQKLTAIAVVVSAVAAYAVLSKDATLEYLAVQYPDIDRKIAKVAYRKIMSKVLRGELSVNNYSTADFDALFLKEVAQITQK